MSYVRWSSIVNCELTTEEWISLHCTTEKASTLEGIEKWCKENKTPDAEVSDWYIFWHSMGGYESDKRTDQYLAMWNCGEAKTPVLDYSAVKTMLETDDWSQLGYENITQKHVLVDCVKRWIRNVETDCK
jgi:hypothetical protein